MLKRVTTCCEPTSSAQHVRYDAATRFVVRPIAEHLGIEHMIYTRLVHDRSVAISVCGVTLRVGNIRHRTDSCTSLWVTSTPIDNGNIRRLQGCEIETVDREVGEAVSGSDQRDGITFCLKTSPRNTR